MVDFGEVWNLQEKENARKDKVKSGSKGNCKEWNLQKNRLAKVTFSTLLMYVNEYSEMIKNIIY